MKEIRKSTKYFLFSFQGKLGKSLTQHLSCQDEINLMKIILIVLENKQMGRYNPPDHKLHTHGDNGHKELINKALTLMLKANYYTATSASNRFLSWSLA